MKRIFVLVLFGSLSASLLAAQSGRAQTQFSNSVLDEVARLSAAGTPDGTLIAYIHARRSRLESPSADDLIHLKQAGVSEKVVQYLAGLSVPADRAHERRRTVRDEDASDDGSDVVAYDSPGGYYRPYSSFYFGAGFYSPFYYPRFGVFRGGFGHHHHHGRGRR